MGYWSGLGFGLGGWLVMLGCIVLIVGVVALIAWLGSRSAPATHPQAAGAAGGHDAMELLRMRFARGEITSDEFLAAKQTLEDGR